MLVLRRFQIANFEKRARAGFEDEMVAHCKVFSPRLCVVLGEDQLRVVVCHLIDSARIWGFTQRGPVRLYIEMGFLFGSGFADDPQYPWIRKILESGKYPSQMQKSVMLRQRILDYQIRVNGPEDRFTRSALERIRIMAQHPFPVSSTQFLADMMRLIKRLYPEKASHVGDQGLESIVRKAASEASARDMSSVHTAVLFTTLMFAFGHRCVADPLYPWIQNTLADERIIDNLARAKRLEKKSLTWLEHVLSALD